MSALLHELQQPLRLAALPTLVETLRIRQERKIDAVLPASAICAEDGDLRLRDTESLLTPEA